MPTNRPVPKDVFSRLREFVESEARSAGTLDELAALRAHFQLASEIISARRRKRLTQQAVARASGVPQSEISRLERGQSNPTLRTVMAVARSLGFTLAFVPIAKSTRKKPRRRA